MKKIKTLACLCFAAVLLLTACSYSGGEATGEISGEDTGSSSNDTSEQVKQDLSQLDTSDYSGSFGMYTTLTDPISGVPVMDAVLPYGWTAQVQCDWSFVSTNNPCIANIVFTSPDQKAAVLIQTSHDYLQSYDTSGLFPHQDYIDQETYIVHLAYKNAGQVLDMCFNGLLGTGGTVVKEDPVPDEVQSLLDQTAQTYLTTLVNGINQIGGGYGVTAQASGSEGTVSMRRYRYTGSDGQSYPAVCKATENRLRPKRALLFSCYSFRRKEKHRQNTGHISNSPLRYGTDRLCHGAYPYIRLRCIPFALQAVPSAFQRL